MRTVQTPALKKAVLLARRLRLANNPHGDALCTWLSAAPRRLV